MCCEYCGKPLDKDKVIHGEDGKVFCPDTDCMKMYYYEVELDNCERGKFVWF